MNQKLRTALLISGSGTTAQAIIQSCQSGKLQGKIDPVVVISSRPDAGGTLKAQALGIPTAVVDLKTLAVDLLALFDHYHIDLISQNGWLPLTPLDVINKYPGMIINQHPGPLDEGKPDFGGKGMYGARVTCARLAFLSLLKQHGELTPADMFTEATTHHVTTKFDEGSIIRVMRLTLDDIPSLPDLAAATPTIQSQLLPLEHQNVIHTLADFASNTIPHFHRRKPLIPHHQLPFLHQAKKLAIKLCPTG